MKKINLCLLDKLKNNFQGTIVIYFLLKKSWHLCIYHGKIYLHKAKKKSQKSWNPSVEKKSLPYLTVSKGVTNNNIIPFLLTYHSVFDSLWDLICLSKHNKHSLYNLSFIHTALSQELCLSSLFIFYLLHKCSTLLIYHFLSTDL